MMFSVCLPSIICPRMPHLQVFKDRWFPSNMLSRKETATTTTPPLEKVRGWKLVKTGTGMEIKNAAKKTSLETFEHLQVSKWIFVLFDFFRSVDYSAMCDIRGKMEGRL